jgi:DNA-binding transcriptional regulator YdaS (Cro superfamily)
MSTKTVKEAIDAAGGTSVIARIFDIAPASVSGWIERGRVPADRCPAIERFSNGAARCEDLCADVDWNYLRATQPEPNTASLCVRTVDV